MQGCRLALVAYSFGKCLQTKSHGINQRINCMLLWFFRSSWVTGILLTVSTAWKIYVADVFFRLAPIRWACTELSITQTVINLWRH